MDKKFKYTGMCSCGKPSHHKGHCKGVNALNQAGIKRKYKGEVEEEELEELE